MKIEPIVNTTRPRGSSDQTVAVTPHSLHEIDVPADLDADAALVWEDNRGRLTKAMFDVIELRPDGIEQLPGATDGSSLLVEQGGGRWALAPAVQVVRLVSIRMPPSTTTWRAWCTGTASTSASGWKR